MSDFNLDIASIDWSVVVGSSGAFIKITHDGKASVSEHFSDGDAAKLLDCFHSAWQSQKTEIARIKHDVIYYRESYNDLIGKLSDFIPISGMLGAMKSNEAIVAHIRKAMDAKS